MNESDPTCKASASNLVRVKEMGKHAASYAQADGAESGITIATSSATISVLLAAHGVPMKLDGHCDLGGLDFGADPLLVYVKKEHVFFYFFPFLGCPRSIRLGLVDAVARCRTCNTQRTHARELAEMKARCDAEMKALCDAAATEA